MTVRQYIMEHGWIGEDFTSKDFVNVKIYFINDDNQEDATEFSIGAYKLNELCDLFDEFCKDNNFDNDTVEGVEVTEVAKSMDELS